MSVNVEGAWSNASRLASKRSLAAATLAAGGGVALLAFAAVLAEILSSNPPSLTIAVGGCLLLAFGLLLVLTQYELAITIGFLLLAVVLVEPAPGDALFGLIMAVAAVTGRFKIARLPRTALIIVASFLLLNILSLVDVISWSVAVRFFAATFYLCVFSLWLAGYIDRPSRSRKLVRAYLFVAVLSAGLTSIALFIHFPSASTLIGDGERGKGLFKDPNVYGPFLVPIALILAEEIFNPRLLRLRRPLMLGCFLVLTLGVVFSYSRAAWLNYAIGLIVLIGIAVLRSPDRRAISLLLVVLVSGAATAGTIIGTGSLGFLNERAHLQSYDTQRFGAQSYGLKTGLEHPFGVGPGQFDVVSPVSSHSLYIRSLSEQGLLGLLVIIALVVGTLAFATTNVLHGRDTYGISAAALLAAWSGLVVNSFFVDTLHWRILWLVAALIWAGAMRRGQVAAPTATPDAALAAMPGP